MNKYKQFRLPIVLIFAIMANMFSIKGYSVCQTRAYFTTTSTHICVGETVIFMNKTGAAAGVLLAFNWNFDGGANNDTASNIYANGCFSSGVAPSACQTFSRQFNTPGSYTVVLRVYEFDIDQYNLIDTIYSNIVVEANDAWANINATSTYICNTPFKVTDNSFKLKSTENSLGKVTSISWILYDYNQNNYISDYSEIGETLDIKTFGSGGMVNLPIGQYWIKMETQSFCNSSIVDSINFFITGGIPEINSPEVVCIGDSVMFVGNSSCPDIWNWNFGDGSTTTTNDTVYHIYNNTGTYQVSLQTNAGGDYGYDNIEVVQAQIPIILGYKNNCDDVVTYSIENFNSNYSYTWSTQIYNQATGQFTTGQYNINGNTNVETANTVNIDWTTAAFPQLPNYVVITVEAQLDGSNCSAISTNKVYECCEGDMGSDAIYWHDTTITSAHILNGYDISINGTVILKDSLVMNTISSSSGGIWFGPYAKLILETGGYFELHDGNLRGGCNYMWDGVYVNSPNEVVKINGSSIENSINGIVSENGAPLYIDTCYFNDNLRSIQIKNYRRTKILQDPLYYTGRIQGCNFNTASGDPLYTINYYKLNAPYQSEPSECGIWIENVENIQIGEPNGMKNTFNRSRYAIMAYNSAVSIYNNEFRYIKDVTNTGWFSFVHGAIFVSNISTSYPSINYSKKLFIGSNGNGANTFSNCNTAIFANNITADISNNSIDNCNVGVRLIDFTNGSRIDSNIVSSTSEGILVYKPIGGYRNIKVRENDFPYSQELETGISLINVNSGYGNIAQVSNNTIRFVGNQSVQHYGIMIQDCNGIKVNSNNIKRGGVSLGDIENNWDKSIGIKTARSKACQITDNYFLSMGTGIWTNGECNLTQYSCNDMLVYKYGFYFGPLTKITEQGTLGDFNTHNKWSTTSAISGNEKLATDGAYSNLNWTGNIKWYNGPSYIANYIPNQLGGGAGIILPYQNNTDNHYCIGTTSGTGTSTGGGTSTGNGSNSGTLAILEDDNITPEIRDYLFEDMMEGLEYVDLLNEFRAYDAKFLYEMLADDTTLMWLGGDRDVNYQEFFDSVRMSNIGDFTKVYDLIEEENYIRAASINNQIEPTSDIYANLKNVLSIYLDTWCKGKFELEEEDYNSLFEIANQNPYEGGDGVYTARIMINYNPDDYEVAFRIKKDNDINLEKDAISLYPNPAQNNLNVEFENPEGDEISGLIKVFNISGKLVLEREFNTHSSFCLLNISNLANGAYIFNIQINNKDNTAYRSQSGKLIVLKP